jgi:cell division protein FtsB
MTIVFPKSKVVATAKRLGRNRYFWVSALFIVWMTFFDAYNLGMRRKLAAKIKRYQADKIYYLTKIEELKLQNDLLKRDGKAVERLAREKYLMKKDNEDLYVVRK